MNKQFEVVGQVRHVESAGVSLNGNVRKMVIIDPVGRTDLDIVYTRPDSSYGYKVSSLFGKYVKATISMYRGKMCIDFIEEIDS